MKKFIILSALAVMMVANVAWTTEVFVSPTGVTLHNKDKAQPGYNLYYPDYDDQTYLFDNDGKLLHTWPAVGNPTLLDDGSIIGTNGRDSGSGSLDIVIYNWNGEETHRFVAPDKMAFHHDWRIINDPKRGEKTMMTIARVHRTPDEIEADGFEAGAVTSRATLAGHLDTDCLLEYTMDGKLIWMWEFYDRFVQDTNPGFSSYDAYAATNYNKYNTSFFGPIGVDYNHSNSFDYNEHLDQIVINPLAAPEVYVIDHNTTTEEAKGERGDFLYRWGSTYTHGVGDVPQTDSEGNITYGESFTFNWLHNIQWIDDGKPGAGSFLVFANTFHMPGQSLIVQFNPYEGDKYDGNYVKQEDGGYKYVLLSGKDNVTLSSQVEWAFCTGIWGAWAKQGFYSGHISGVERMENGNYLICSGEAGHVFEITPGYDEATGKTSAKNGQIVWEFKNPFVAERPYSPERAFKMAPSSMPGEQGQVFRMVRYPKDHPAFRNKSMVPMGEINDESTWNNFTGFGFGSGQFGGGGAGGSGESGGATGGY
jgi:hypothetical protein